MSSSHIPSATSYDHSIQAETGERLGRFMFAVLFLSGACGLVYEVVWMRVFGFVFGNTAFAISAVLCSFMTGLALGSYLLGRYARRDVNPLAVYAWLELVIAASAVFFLPLVGLIQPVNAAITQRFLGHTIPLNLVRYLMALLLMIVPTTCMGGTIPVLGKFFVDAPARVGRQVARLYAVNTFGAVAGCLLAGFVLVRYAGLSETLLGTAAVGVLIGLIWMFLGLAVPASILCYRSLDTLASPSAPGTSARSICAIRSVRSAGRSCAGSS